MSDYHKSKKQKQKKNNSTFSIHSVINTRNLLIILPAFILAFVYTYLKSVENEIKYQLAREDVVNTNMLMVQKPYPVLNTVLSVNTATQSANLNSPLLSAQAVYVVDDDSKVPLYAKNSHLRFSMASTTKIMTALTALDYFKLDDIITVYSNNIVGAKVGFSKGEQFTFEDMLYAIMLPSGNDAAVAIAENYPGGIDAFVEKMNEKAQLLHLNNTHFSDPAGLDDMGDYTTAEELSQLASHALQHPVLSVIASTKEKVLVSKTGKEYRVQNLNRLLGQYGVNGLKTGFTQEAGQVLVTSKIEQNRTIIIVVMKSDDRFYDTTQLLTLINGNISYKDFSQ